MKRFEGRSSISRPFKHAAVTLGNFDGVHRGHRVIIEKTLQAAHKRDGEAVVYTFYPHPVQLLAPHSCPPLIQTIEQRLEALEDLGVDACVVDAFSFNLAHEEPREFFQKVLLDTLGAESIIIGYDFTFGLHRRGTAELLRHLGSEANIEISVVDAQFDDDLLISSTEIRRAVADGNVEHAAKLIGRPFAVRGTVVAGRGIGSALGAHTANLHVENELTPREGVYVSSACVEPAARPLPAITSIGYNPTFGKGDFSFETHVLDYDNKLLGARIDVLLHARIRGQIAFDTPETLKDQIARDIATSRRWHDRTRV